MAIAPAHLQKRHPNSSSMKRVAALILGGGSGTRLFPLTLTRCKPAVSFGGRYRLIDIPMSNALNSGCDKIYIFTQFLSASLHQHILKAYRMEMHSQGFVEILSAEQKPSKRVWYQGTADAIRQNIEYIQNCNVDYFLILSGDQLYQMNLEAMVAKAEERNADLIVASLPIDARAAARMGVLKINNDDFIQYFTEKPESLSQIDQMCMAPSEIERLVGASSANNLLGSMGIYLFKRAALLNLLNEDTREDFGKHLIPTQVAKGKAAAYVFPGYWEDIGTIDSYYKANIALTNPTPPLDLLSYTHPIHTAFHALPPPKISQTIINHSLICEGSEVNAKVVSNSILGPRSRIDSGSTIENSYLFGNDFHDQGMIGKDCLIRKALIDKDVHIGHNVKLINLKQHENFDYESIFIRDGIIIVTKGAKLHDGFVL